MMILFLVQFFLSNSLSAEKHEIHKLIQAKSISDLRNYLNLFQELETARKLCEKRLQHKEFPVACYRKLNLETQLGLIKNSNKASSLKLYDEVCRKAEITGQNPTENDLGEVSTKCQTHIRVALCKKSYREGLVNDCETNL